MLKVQDGTVIEGIFNDDKYIEIVKNSHFATLIIHIDITIQKVMLLLTGGYII